MGKRSWKGREGAWRGGRGSGEMVGGQRRWEWVGFGELRRRVVR